MRPGRGADRGAAPVLTGRPRRVAWPDLLAHPDVEETAVAGTSVGFLAFHAGLEAGTLEIARAAARHSGAALYTVVQPAELRWHVPSSEVDPASSPLLGPWLAERTRAIALHGYGRPGRHHDVLVGGADRQLAEVASEHLAGLVPSLRFVHDPERIPPGLRGRSRTNPVNRTTGGGVQLELPVLARTGEVADALVAALAELAAAWASSDSPLLGQPGAAHLRCAPDSGAGSTVGPGWESPAGPGAGPPTLQ